MTLSIHTIKPTKGAKKKRKRVGRGNAAGQGTYCGRGIKGQKSRSGVSGLKRLGMKQILMRIPKKKGFKSSKPDNQVVNLTQINEHFKEGDYITPKALLSRGLVDKIKLPVKILGEGELKIKGLMFSNVKMSESVKRQVEKMGGKTEVTLRRQGSGGQGSKRRQGGTRK